MFTPNNINFRVISSLALAKFKQDQAFDFNELVNNSSSYKFSSESREILLLNYEIWFKWVLRLEKLLVRSHDLNTYETLLDHIVTSIQDFVIDIDDVMSIHPGIFHSDERNIIRKTHSLFIDLFIHEVKEMSNLPKNVAFPKIVNILSNHLHNLLFELHEYEAIANNAAIPFLSFTPECLDSMEKLNEFPLLHRAKIYNKKYNVKKFFIKNYSKTDISPKCLDILRSEGFEILGVENLCDNQ